MELLGRELGTHWADFGNVEPNPNRTMPWSGRRLLSTRLLTRARNIGLTLARARAPVASYPKGKVMEPLLELLNDEAW